VLQISRPDLSGYIARRALYLAKRYRIDHILNPLHEMMNELDIVPVSEEEFIREYEKFEDPHHKFDAVNSSESEEPIKRVKMGD